MKLLEDYKSQSRNIKGRLKEFKSLPKEHYLEEHLFCILTPQSNAKKCWKAIEELKKMDLMKLKENDIKLISDILKDKTRFHNNKSKYLVSAIKNWEETKKRLDNQDIISLRNWLAENIKGYGLKEAGHFLRNIGKSNNQIAILDRHILRNLVSLEVIKDEQIKSKKDYLKLEQEFLKFSKTVNIPIDELDLLFWSQGTGEIFK
jgi:N-glycosylase/DNA lyase